MNLTSEHIDILNHTQYRAANQMYCGDSPAMQELVAGGLMVFAGEVSWCPDKYFSITEAGSEALKRKASVTE